MYESPLHLLAVDGYSAKLLCSARRAMGRRSYYQIRGAINKQTNKQTNTSWDETVFGLLPILPEAGFYEYCLCIWMRCTDA